LKREIQGSSTVRTASEKSSLSTVGLSVSAENAANPLKQDAPKPSTARNAPRKDDYVEFESIKKGTRLKFESIDVEIK